MNIISRCVDEILGAFRKTVEVDIPLDCEKEVDTPSGHNLPCSDFEHFHVTVIDAVRGNTQTSPERIYALIEAVRYLSRANIEGSIVECGVWRGGSMQAVALTLRDLGDGSRDLYLYDTFEGMSEPTTNDSSFQGEMASELLAKQERSDEMSIWCRAGIEQVKDVMISTGYESSKLKFVQGPVEDSLLSNVPERIALLRLDTDWYESTKIELEVLYPLLVPGGVILIDDYGHWQGCKKAVDEFFGGLRSEEQILLQRIDYTGRIAVKR